MDEQIKTKHFQVKSASLVCAHLGALHSLKSTDSSSSRYSWHSFYPWQPLCTWISSLTFVIAGVSRQAMKSLLARYPMKTFSACKKNRTNDVRCRGQQSGKTNIKWEQTMTAYLLAQENLDFLEAPVLLLCPSCEQSSGEKRGASLQADHSDHGHLVAEKLKLV